MNEKIIKAVNNTNVSDDNARMIVQAEVVKQLLEYCAVRPGAKITVAVEHDEGHRAVAKLYDNAELIGCLHRALENFQSDIM